MVHRLDLMVFKRDLMVFKKVIIRILSGKMPDYQNGRIYTIRCRTDNSLIYVDSTTMPYHTILTP